MYVSLLQCQMRGVGPEDRLVLALFARLFDVTGAVRLKVTDLAGCLGVSPSVLMRSMSKLSANEAYLSVKTVLVGRGRPSRSYEISPLFRARLSEVSKVSLPPVCMQVVEHLLSIPTGEEKAGSEAVSGRVVGYQRPPVRKKSDQLTLASRWLLAVLVSHASEFGVVRDLGFSTLRQLTGMSELRMKAQLQRLAESGVIRSYVPGVSNSLFAQTKVSTTYFLNLNHPSLGRVRNEGAVVVIRGSIDYLQLDAFTELKPFVHQIFQQLTNAAFNVLCMQLDQSVSLLLSTRWRDLGLPECPDLSGSLQDAISANFRCPPVTCAGFPEIGESDWSAVLAHFCRLVLEKARDIRRELVRMHACDLDGVRIQIIPAPSRGDGSQLVTLLIGRTPVPRYSCLVIKYHPFKVCEPYSDEAELSAEDRFRFGLQSRPKG